MVRAISKMPYGKSPGLDGFPIEFYNKYWEKIHVLFMDYVNEVKTLGFEGVRNVSVLKLIYKKTGEIYLLQANFPYQRGCQNNN